MLPFVLCSSVTCVQVTACLLVSASRQLEFLSFQLDPDGWSSLDDWTHFISCWRYTCSWGLLGFLFIPTLGGLLCGPWQPSWKSTRNPSMGHMGICGSLPCHMGAEENFGVLSQNFFLLIILFFLSNFSILVKLFWDEISSWSLNSKWDWKRLYFWFPPQSLSKNHTLWDLGPRQRNHPIIVSLLVSFFFELTGKFYLISSQVGRKYS